jgi:hypothetical protein
MAYFSKRMQQLQPSAAASVKEGRSAWWVLRVNPDLGHWNIRVHVLQSI